MAIHKDRTVLIFLHFFLTCFTLQSQDIEDPIPMSAKKISRQLHRKIRTELRQGKITKKIHTRATDINARDGLYFATPIKSKYVRISRNPQDDARTVFKHEFFVDNAAFSPTGDILIAVGDCRKLGIVATIRNLLTGAKINLPHLEDAQHYVYKPDMYTTEKPVFYPTANKVLIPLPSCNTVKIFDTKTGEQKGSVSHEKVNFALFNNAGTIFTTNNGSTIKFWNAETLGLIRTLNCPNNESNKAMFDSRDENFMVTSLLLREVYIYNLYNLTNPEDLQMTVIEGYENAEIESAIFFKQKENMPDQIITGETSNLTIIRNLNGLALRVIQTTPPNHNEEEEEEELSITTILQHDKEPDIFFTGSSNGDINLIHEPSGKVIYTFQTSTGIEKMVLSNHDKQSYLIALTGLDAKEYEPHEVEMRKLPSKICTSLEIARYFSKSRVA